jgi:hypothetical protein
MPHPADRPTWRYGNAEAELLGYHLSMLLDEACTGAQQEAITSSVRHGDVMVDLGASSVRRPAQMIVGAVVTRQHPCV